MRSDTLPSSAANTSGATEDQDRAAAQRASDAAALLDVLANLQAGSASNGQPRNAADLIRESREGIDKILSEQKAKAEKAHEADAHKQATHKTDKVDLKPTKTVDLSNVLKAYREFDAEKVPSKTGATSTTDTDAPKADTRKKAA